MKNILILGGGFAGLVTAEELSQKLGDEYQITLISPQRDFTFYPALVRYAFGEVDEAEIKFDLATKLHDINVRHIEGELLHFNPELHRVKVAGKEFNGSLSYDYLVIAIGRRLATEQIPGFFEYANHIMGTRAAAKFGLAASKFTGGKVVVGLTPDSRLPVPVCETAFAMAKRIKNGSATLTEISVVFPESVQEAFGGADIHKKLTEAFKQHGIKLVENFPVSEVKSGRLISNDRREMAFDLLMLVPPFKGQGRLRENGVTDKSGFVEVDEFMRVKGMNSIYAAGDIASFPGPKLAHMAIGQAKIVAATLLSEIKGEEPVAVYFHEIASIIDQGGADSIYLHYGIWDDSLYKVKSGNAWGLIKRVHDKVWRARHKKAGWI